MERKAETNKAIKGAALGLKNLMRKTTEKLEEEEKLKSPKGHLEAVPINKPKESTLDRMKESVADTQKDMQQEDFENIKLTPILKEAFELWSKLNKFHQDNKNKAKHIQKQRKSLSAKK